MQDLTPIPIPLDERWREIRLRTLPLVAFIIAVIAIIILWNMALLPSTLVGEAEQINSTVISPVAGTLTELKVKRYQMVTKGTSLGTITPSDVRATLEIMRRQQDNLSARLDPELTAREFDLKLQRLRLPWLQQKVNLATAETNLESAKTEANRAQTLFKQNAITAQAYEVIKLRKDALETGIEEQKKLIGDLEAEIQKLSGPQTEDAKGNTMEKLLATQESQLAKMSSVIGPVELIAPIDGMVNFLSHRPGESVTEGESIVVITGVRPETIVGYLREPFPLEPEVGMQVEVRTRGRHPVICVSQIVSIGSQFETIVNPLLHPNPALIEVGLPIQVSIPANLELRPGGLVDLTLRARK